MSNQPNIDRGALSRGAIAGLVLGVVSIILFVILWIVLGNAGVSQLPRLFASLCLPPGILAAGFGFYVVVWRPRRR